MEGIVPDKFVMRFNIAAFKSSARAGSTPVPCRRTSRGLRWRSRLMMNIGRPWKSQRGWSGAIVGA